MADIVTRYDKALEELKNEAVQGLDKEFCTRYISKGIQDVDYINIGRDTEIDGNIDITKKAINVYKGKLSKLATNETPQTSGSDEELIKKYLMVMALFAYLRVAMTIFILLQQRKLSTECAVGKAAQGLEVKFRENLNKIVAATKIDSVVTNTEQEIETAATDILIYIANLKQHNKDLSTLISTSIPLIAKIDATAFPNVV